MLSAAVILLLAGPALAPGRAGATTAACPMKPALPPELYGWSAMMPLTVASNARVLDAATLKLGKSARATLAPAETVLFPVAPGHAAKAGTRGGLFAFAVATSGSYRIALSEPAWIDVIANGRTLPSSAHSHAAICSGIAKLVDFQLTPGNYMLQVSDAPTRALLMMVTRLPG